jgi:hypothetical protein
MIARYCLRVFGLFLIGCIAPSFAGAQVVLPNNHLLGKDAATSDSLFVATDAKSPIFPVSIQLDIQDGKIRGLTAKYPKEVGYQVVKNAINQHDQKSMIPEHANGSKNVDLTLWRNEDEGVAIQLYSKEKGEIELIVLPISAQH